MSLPPPFFLLFLLSLSPLAVRRHLVILLRAADWPVQCAGPSMEPTINPSGDLLFAERFSSWNGKLERGDVVIAIPPVNERLKVCKRIIALVSRKTYLLDTISVQCIRHQPKWSSLVLVEIALRSW